MWVFEYSKGMMWGPDGAAFGKCYAGGNLGKVPEAVNDPAYQSVPFVGPLPEGFYTFGALERNTKLGPTAIPLIPDASNVMHGRGDFYEHWDTPAHNQGASEGCIVMLEGGKIEQMWNSQDHRLQVIARLDTDDITPTRLPDDSF